MCGFNLSFIANTKSVSLLESWHRSVWSFQSKDIPVQWCQRSSRSSLRTDPRLFPQEAAVGCGPAARHLWGTRPAPLVEKHTTESKTRSALEIDRRPASHQTRPFFSSPGSTVKVKAKQIKWASFWWCSSGPRSANLIWKVSHVEIIWVRQCRREQRVAGLFLLLQEARALISAAQSSS